MARFHRWFAPKIGGATGFRIRNRQGPRTDRSPPPSGGTRHGCLGGGRCAGPAAKKRSGSKAVVPVRAGKKKTCPANSAQQRSRQLMRAASHFAPTVSKPPGSPSPKARRTQRIRPRPTWHSRKDCRESIQLAARCRINQGREHCRRTAPRIANKQIDQCRPLGRACRTKATSRRNLKARPNCTR